jgi:oligopeptide/dipeptide ABC transporter ATP-binding protein
VIESAPVGDIFHHPQHPYTKALLDSIPKAGRKEQGKRLPTIEGIVPSLMNLPKGCRFADRCGIAQPRCRTEEPLLVSGPDGRPVRCHTPLTNLITRGERP